MEDLIKANPRTASVDRHALANILQDTFGDIACDPDRYGSPYRMNLSPKCSVCGLQKMDLWSPIEGVERDIPSVTYHVWQSLTAAEKARRVDQVLMQFNY